MSISTREEIEQALPQFYGTEHYYLFNLLFTNLFLTDGANWLANHAGAWWLMDVIASHQPFNHLSSQPFQAWTIEVVDDRATVTCDDGNGNILLRQHIGYTDFPLPKFELWLEYAQDPNGDVYGVILLPSEH